MLFDEPLNSEEIHLINRAQVAMLLHKMPSEIDAMPYADFVQLMDVWQASEKLKQRNRQ